MATSICVGVLAVDLRGCMATVLIAAQVEGLIKHHDPMKDFTGKKPLATNEYCDVYTVKEKTGAKQTLAMKSIPCDSMDIEGDGPRWG